VWFFSFIAYFSSVEAEHTEEAVILLLDEPGLSLHGTAQADFLRYINERLASSYQVLYTTHSPFMVEPEHFDRVRTVEDVPPSGTKASADIFRSQPGTSLPLLTKISVELFQSLMVGPNTLLVEGGSDYLYLRLLSRESLRRGGEGLDERWVLTPVTGVGKFEPFFRLYAANKLNVVVLMDGSTYDKKLVDELRKDGSVQRVVTIGEIVGTDDADIEDLLGADFYLSLVAKAFGIESLDAGAFTSQHPRIARRVEEHFTACGINGGKFSHYRPAEYLREHPELLCELDERAIATARRLMERLNGLIRSEQAYLGAPDG
jgi:AAA ATPase-like protein